MDFKYYLMKKYRLAEKNLLTHEMKTAIEQEYLNSGNHYYLTFKKYVGIIREMDKQIGSREPSPASFFCSFIQYLDIK